MQWTRFLPFCMAMAASFWPYLFPIIIGLSVEISDNPIKRLAYFRFCGNPFQRFELREARIKKQENLRFSRPCLDYKLSENKQGQEMVELLQQRLLRSQQRMKASWQEQNRKIFVVGDKFWLKLQLYVHTSVAKHANHKLSFRYFGPFEFESKIGSVAYKLKMPTLSNIHLVFHVSLLKKVIGDITLTTHVLPPKASCISTEVPEIVWDQRLKTKNKRVVSQLLIKWRDWLAEMATWEDEDTFLLAQIRAPTC